MNAGSLRERIEIHAPTIIKNDVGEQETRYLLKYSTRAKKLNNGGSRDVENHEVVYDYTKTFEVRAYVPVSEFDRIKFKDKYYRILSIDTDMELQKTIIHTELVNE